jgi:hypothetical protein
LAKAEARHHRNLFGAVGLWASRFPSRGERLVDLTQPHCVLIDRDRPDDACAERVEPRRLVEKPPNLGGERIGISGRKKEAVVVVPHHFRHTSEVRGDHRHAAGKRFPDDERGILDPDGWDDEHIDVRETSRHTIVGHRSAPPNGRMAEPRRHRQQVVVVAVMSRGGTEHVQCEHAARQPIDRIKQHMQPFRGLQPAGKPQSQRRDGATA